MSRKECYRWGFRNNGLILQNTVTPPKPRTMFLRLCTIRKHVIQGIINSQKILDKGKWLFPSTQQQTVCEKSLMGKVREPVLLLGEDFIAEQSAESKAGVGAFHGYCVGLYGAARHFCSGSSVLFRVWFSKPLITRLFASFAPPLPARLCTFDCFFSPFIKEKVKIREWLCT